MVAGSLFYTRPSLIPLLVGGVDFAAQIPRDPTRDQEWFEKICQKVDGTKTIGNMSLHTNPITRSFLNGYIRLTLTTRPFTVGVSRVQYDWSNSYAVSQSILSHSSAWTTCLDIRTLIDISDTIHMATERTVSPHLRSIVTTGRLLLQLCPRKLSIVMTPRFPRSALSRYTNYLGSPRTFQSSRASAVISFRLSLGA